MFTNKKITLFITMILLVVFSASFPVWFGSSIYADDTSDETPLPYSVSFSGNGGKASYTKKTVTEENNYGSLPSAKRNKHKFLGWYTKKSGGIRIKSNTIVKPEHGKKLYAHWKRVYIVVINAGHQGKGNLGMERIGPGSKNKKYKVAYGTRGVSTKVAESKRVLRIAKKLKNELKSKGIKVYMIRTKQNVNISNATRAKKANRKKADLVISLHCDASGSSSTKGITMLVPKKNKWTKKFYSKSRKAGKTVQKYVIKSTKASNRGISKRGDLTGFNWSKVPTILIEMGFMTNPTEDRKLGKASYQKKLIKGMAKGIVKYLKIQK